MNCKKISTKIVCYDDGILKKDLIAHYEYGKDIDDEIILVSTRYTEADGITVVDTSAGTVTVGACVMSCDITREVYRIAGTAAGTSTDIFVGTGVVGNTVTIVAPFKSISTHILRETQQDPGDGSVATTTIDNVVYYMGGGDVYATYLPDFNTSDCSEIYTEDVVISVTGESYVEIWVTY